MKSGSQMIFSKTNKLNISILLKGLFTKDVLQISE